MSNSLLASTAKGSLLLAEIRRKYPNYHPIMAMVDIAHDTNASLELQFNCHKTVAKYIEPELKSIEVKGEIRETKQVRVTLFDEAKESAARAEIEDAAFTEIPFSAESEAINSSITDF